MATLILYFGMHGRLNKPILVRQDNNEHTCEHTQTHASTPKHMQFASRYNMGLGRIKICAD